MKKYNFDEIIERRNTNSEKWDEGLFHNSDLPKEYIPMWTADMDFACAQPILRHVIHQKTQLMFVGLLR